MLRVFYVTYFTYLLYLSILHSILLLFASWRRILITLYNVTPSGPSPSFHICPAHCMCVIRELFLIISKSVTVRNVLIVVPAAFDITWLLQIGHLRMLASSRRLVGAWQFGMHGSSWGFVLVPFGGWLAWHEAALVWADMMWITCDFIHSHLMEILLGNIEQAHDSQISPKSTRLCICRINTVVVSQSLGIAS